LTKGRIAQHMDGSIVFVRLRPI